LLLPAAVAAGGLRLIPVPAPAPLILWWDFSISLCVHLRDAVIHNFKKIHRFSGFKV
jgi:hypothetical protein